MHDRRNPLARRFAHQRARFRARVGSRRQTRLAALALGGILLMANAAHAIDSQAWAGLLADHTTETSGPAGVLVDYRTIAKDPRWKPLLASLERETLAGKSRSETLAFWINAYNILTIDVVARNFPLQSINDVGSFFRPVWKRPAGRAAGASRTLDEIEHGILRKLGEPRIHAAIVCASTSCPPLSREPFVAAQLDAQLDRAMRGWLASETKGVRIDRAKQRVMLSRIFDWFEEDFQAGGGVLAFVARYRPPAEAEWLRSRASEISVDHFDYDWGVNHWDR